MATRAMDFEALDAGEPPHLAAARARAYATPLDDLELLDPDLWTDDSHWPYFERLRDEDPVHYHANGRFGPYWSVTRYADIMAVDTDHARFSSDAHLGGITAKDMDQDFILPMFIAMDPPKHDVQRKAVSPIVSPGNLAHLEGLIRERAQTIFDNLPVGETFDWVDRVSIELTTQMLATLFDFPWEDRRLLTYWSDKATADETVPGNPTKEERQNIMLECLMYFTRLWNERVNAAEPGNDLVSMLAHNPATRDMVPMEYLGNLHAADRRRQRHDAQLDHRRADLHGGEPDRVGQAARRPGPRRGRGQRDHPLPDAARPYAPHRARRRRARRQDDPEGRPRRHVVRLGQPRSSGRSPQPDRFMDRPAARRASTCRSASASTAASATGSPRCSSRSSGRKSSSATRAASRSWAPPTRVPSAFVKGYTSLPVRIPA